MEERIGQEYRGFHEISLQTHNKGFELVFEHCVTDHPYPWHARFYLNGSEAVLVVYYPGIKTIIQTDFEDKKSAEIALTNLTKTK